MRAQEKEKGRIIGLRFLSRTAMNLVEISPEEDVYQFIGERLKEIAGNSVVIISSFDEASSSFYVRAVVGLGGHADTITEILGRHPVGITSAINDEARLALTSGKLVKVPGGLYEYSFGELPKTICHVIEQLLGLGDIYDIGFTWKGKLFGSAAIFTRKGTKLRNQSVIETLVRQASVALQRWQIEKALQQAHDDLEIRVKERTADLIKANEALKLQITERKQAEEKLKRSTDKLVNALEDAIQAIAMIVEMRDPYTAGHQRRVTQLACAIAKEMALSEEQTDALRLAGLIHDVGKVRVPAEILTNPDGLSEAEFNIVKTHPLIGYEILKTIEFPWPIAQIVYQHHERLDGSGYPSSLSGEDILLEARILAVADVVEAMSSHRPYRPAIGIDKALNEISQKKGVLYDANVVDACLSVFTEKSFEFE